MKLGNQWRGLGPEELKFLADKANEKRAAEKLVEDQEKRDLAEYREYVSFSSSAQHPISLIPSYGQFKDDD